MNIDLEIEKYNYYRLLGESYEPKHIDLAINKNNKYIIVENVIYDIEKNKSLGLYYKNNLISEQGGAKFDSLSKERMRKQFGDDDVEKIGEDPWDTWDMEDWIDLGVAGISTALDASGIGTVAAKVIDVAHSLSFVYRGFSRNNHTYTFIGILGLIITLALPVVGSGLKGFLVATTKSFAKGKNLSALVAYLAKSKIFREKIIPNVSSIMQSLKGLDKKFIAWAKEYEYFKPVWDSVKPLWNKAVKWFDDFMNSFKQKTGVDLVKSTSKLRYNAFDDVSKAISNLHSKVQSNQLASSFLDFIPLGLKPFTQTSKKLINTFINGRKSFLKQIDELDNQILKTTKEAKNAADDTIKKTLDEKLKTLNYEKGAIESKLSRIQKRGVSFLQGIGFWLYYNAAIELIYEALCYTGLKSNGFRDSFESFEKGEMTEKELEQSFPEPYRLMNKIDKLANTLSHIDPSNPVTFKKFFLMADCSEVIGAKGWVEQGLDVILGISPEIGKKIKDSKEFKDLQNTVNQYGSQGSLESGAEDVPTKPQ
jgi:hypothetical protein